VAAWCWPDAGCEGRQGCNRIAVCDSSEAIVRCKAGQQPMSHAADSRTLQTW
jgi:hypothetical protein